MVWMEGPVSPSGMTAELQLDTLTAVGLICLNQQQLKASGRVEGKNTIQRCYASCPHTCDCLSFQLLRTSRTVVLRPDLSSCKVGVSSSHLGCQDDPSLTARVGRESESRLLLILGQKPAITSV